MVRTELNRCPHVRGLHPLAGGRWLVAFSQERFGPIDLAWVDPTSGELRRELTNAAGAVTSGDGTRLAIGRLVRAGHHTTGLLQIGDADARVTEWEFVPNPDADGRVLRSITPVRFGSDGAVWGVYVWGTPGPFQADGSDRHELIRLPAGGPPIRVMRWPEDMTQRAVAPDGTRVAGGAGFNSAAVRGFELPTGREFWQFRDVRVRTAALVYSPAGDRLAVLDNHRGFFLDATTGAGIVRFSPRTALQSAAAFTPDGRRLLTGDNNGSVCAWDADTGGLVVEWGFGVGPVKAVAVSPDGLTAAAGTADGRIVVWDLDG